MPRIAPAVGDLFLAGTPNSLVGTDANGRLVSTTGSASQNPAVYPAVNRGTSTLPAGCPVATHASGTGMVAASCSTSSLPAVGFLTTATAVGFAGLVQCFGPFTLADWSAIAGTASLAAASAYYLDVAAGRLTTSPVSTTGHFNQRLGTAVSSTTLDIQVSRPILL